MKRIAWVTAVVLALGLVAGGVSFASRAPANDAHPLVLHLLSRATAINDFVDTGPAGLSTGDLYVYSDRLFLADAPDEQVGTTDGRCTLIDPAALRFDCSALNTLTGAGGLAAGEVTAEGALTLVEGSTSRWAVTGGTGAYRTVRGDAVSELGPFEGPHQITVNLVLNP